MAAAEDRRLRGELVRRLQDGQTVELRVGGPDGIFTVPSPDMQEELRRRLLAELGGVQGGAGRDGR